MSNVRPLTTVTAAALVVVALAGCGGQASGDYAGPPTPTTSPTSSAAPEATSEPTVDPAPTATPTPDASPAVTIPSDCTQIVDTATYEATMGANPLNPDNFPRRDGTAHGARTPGIPEAGADPVAVADTAAELDCLWRDPRADVSGLSVQMGRLDQPSASSLLQRAEASGSTCSDSHGGRVCQISSVDPQYGTDASRTYFVRGDLFIAVDQSNFPTNDLLGSILTHLSS